MIKVIFAFAALSGMASVILGAFGSHALRGNLPETTQHAFDTAVAYQMSHSIVLLIACAMMEYWGRHWALLSASWAFVAGIFLFSGSLYLLALTGFRWLGPVTPVGGLMFIAGWGFLAVGIWQNTRLG